MPKLMTHFQSLLAIRDCRIASRTDQHVLYTLALHGSMKAPNISWPCVETLAEETGYCVRTLQRSLLSLKRLGLVKVQRRMNQSNRYRIELDVLANAVQNAKAEKAERERNKKVADADFGDWDDESAADEPESAAQDVEDELQQNETDEDESEAWNENFRKTFFATIDEAENPRYLIAKVYPGSDPLFAEHTLMKTSKTVDEARFVFEKEFLSGYYGKDHSRYEADWQDLLLQKSIQCVGFEIRLYDHYACEDLKP